jgi:DNA-binding NarL/FixJ family response regulator
VPTARRQTDPVPNRRFRVLIVDDHPVVRHGYGQRIALEPDMQVCGEASTAHEALEQIESLRPDIALIDLSLANGDGLDLIKDIKARGEHVRLLVISAHDESVYAERCIRAGAHGYLQKNEAIDKIVAGIRRVMAGDYFLSDAASAQALRKALSANPDEQAASPVESFSDRELQVYELIGQGLTVPQIAEKLFLSPKTIETYRAHLKGKLNLKTSNELTRHAIQWVLERG